jgi:hypothetical protein
MIFKSKKSSLKNSNVSRRRLGSYILNGMEYWVKTKKPIPERASASLI